MATSVRTRFAPSPTGFLHIGGARTALFSWAFARRHGGEFVLRIEDTDVERSTPEAVQAILDGMEWLGLDCDEGPYYQMQRMERYMEVLAGLLESGHAYPCYTTPAELDQLREAQRARGEKPRYDGRWRPAPGKTLPEPPEGVVPVVRFRNPAEGSVVWEDLVKGRIEVANAELDDLIIARPDSTPTYNFCVVVDDMDMQISHVIRGDDHVNNTPRQINILQALGATVPDYAHLSMILGDDGQKLSKRHGAVSVMQYHEQGYLPDAVVNYLARLGWSHGDDEVFSREQLIEWFDLDHITASAAQFNTEKLNWLNAQYIKRADGQMLAAEVQARLQAQDVSLAGGPVLEPLVELYRERAATLNELADGIRPFYVEPQADPDLIDKHFSDAGRAALSELCSSFETLEWGREAIAAAIRAVMKAHSLKMPQVAIPLRVLLLGVTQTPAIDAVVEAMGRERVVERVRAGL